MKENFWEKTLIVLYLLALAPTPVYLIMVLGTLPILPSIFLFPFWINILAGINAIIWFVIYYLIINFLYKKSLTIFGNLKIARILMFVIVLVVLYFSFSNVYVTGDAGGGKNGSNIISLIRQHTKMNAELYQCELQNSNLNKISCLFNISNKNYNYCANTTDPVYCFSEESVIKNDKDICLNIINLDDQKTCIDYYDIRSGLE